MSKFFEKLNPGFPPAGERDVGFTITHITDASGNVVNEYSYDAWGRRRNFTNWTYTVAAQTDLLPGRGFTGHEWLPWFNLYNMNGRLYDPLVGRFLSPDNNVQMPDYTQNFNRYSYALNNPLKYTDPDGEWVHIVVGAAIGGLINLGVKAYQGKINSWGDGFAAFGIGAVAGAVGAATGGAAFTLAGGGAAGAGGFFAGAAGGMAGTAFASPFQSFGNSAYFGDPMMTGKQYLAGIAFGGLTGGAVNGSIALNNGRSFWTGLSQTKTTFTPAPVPAMKFNEPAAKLNTDGMRSKMLDMPSNISRDLPLEGSVPELTLKLPNPEVNFVDKTGTQSLGAGRTAAKQWLQNAGNLERNTLIQDIELVGFKKMSPTTSPVSVFERGGMRIRLDPAQSGTPFNHMHIEYGGNSYNIFLNPVNYKSPAAHIPIR